MNRAIAHLPPLLPLRRYWSRITPVGHLGRYLAGMLLLAASAHALDPNKRLTQYMHTSWRIQDGSLPYGMESVAQTSDGFLWFSADSGDVYSFDGVRFLPSRQPVQGGPVPRALRVFADHSGALWVLHRREIDRLKGDLVSRFKLEGIGFLQSFSEEPDGSVWVLNQTLDQPLCRITGQTVSCLGQSDGIPIAPLNSLLSDRKGGFWLGGETAFAHWHAGVSEIYPVPALKSNAGQPGIESFALAPDGSLWVGIMKAGRGLGLGRLIGGAFKPFVTPTFDGSEVPVNDMIFDRDGNLWVASESEGVFRIKGNVVEHYGHTDGLSDDSVDAVFEDREGIVWALGISGVDSFRDPQVATFSSLEGVGKGEAASGVLASKDGTIWVNSFESLNHLVHGSTTSFRAGHELPGNRVTSMLEDRAGNLWVGVDDELYLFKAGRFLRLPQWKHQPLGLVIGITEDKDGNIWAECGGDPRKLVRIRDFQVREEFSASQIPPGNTLAPDPHGGIWISTRKGYIVLFRNGAIEAQFQLNPGGDQSNRQILAREDGSVLAGSENGLVGWRRGQVQRMTTQNGLPCNRVISFVEDKDKRWWLYTGCGVVQLPDSELQRWWANPAAIVQNRVFDVLDGARPPVSPDRNPVAYSTDGRIWFAGGMAIEMIDPSRPPSNALPAVTFIKALTVDQKELPVTQNVKLSPHPRDLQIDYTSPTYLIPQKVKFRYRLDSYDHDWNDVGTRRQAFYKDLPPGRYTFRVIACNSDGVWNDRAAKLDFSITPAYYETNWFRALCGGALLALLGAAYQARVRQLHMQFALTLDARVAERTRIARELHDTLLQSAHGVLLRFETVSQLLLERPADAKQHLDSAIKQTADFITEARDQVQGLRESTEESNDLAADISSLGEALATDSANRRSPAFHVTVEGEGRPLNPILRDEVYKICAEALRNAFRHSGAQQVEAEIRYDHDQFRLRVRDDGKGIDPAILSNHGSQGHYGLRGMRERATLIGGNLAVWSKADEGTEVELRVPGAYSSARSRWWLPRIAKV